MIFRLTKLVLVLATIVLVAGCKVAVLVVEGGKVQSDAPDCLAGNVCIHDVINTSYTEEFTAVPDAGWRFVRWNSGGEFFCEDSVNPTCVVSNETLAGFPAAEAVVASEATYYIMPIFEPGGVAITDLVAVAGKEWAQVDLFTGVSWDAINAVCPAGVCAGDLASNGATYDMTGWTWASGAEVYSFYNAYLSAGTGSMEDNLGMVATLEPIYDALLAGGMRNMITGPDSERSIGGFLRTDSGAFGDVAIAGDFADAQSAPISGTDYFSVLAGVPKLNDGGGGAPVAGGWFFRSE